MDKKAPNDKYDLKLLMPYFHMPWNHVIHMLESCQDNLLKLIPHLIMNSIYV